MLGGLVELFVETVTDFSSQYGSEISSAYKIVNLIGRNTIYPHYGDYAEAAVFRTYSNIWKSCPSSLKEIKSHAISDYSSEDFIEFCIKYPLIVDNIKIFETYNPGSVERIYFLLNQSWEIMYQRDSCTDIQVLKESRIFSPNIKKSSIPCSKFRVEVNHSHCDYYSEYDAIKVSGYHTSEAGLHCDNLALKHHNKQQEESPNSDHNQDYISFLPEEILIKIFSYFPLKTLSKISSVSRRFLASVDQAMLDFKELNFRYTWAKLDHASLVWIGMKCPKLIRVDLSWCGKNSNFTLFGVCHFFTLIGSNLVTLRLSACAFVNDVVMRSIVKNSPLLQDLDLSSCVNITSSSFADLQHLSNLQYINLYRTTVNSQAIEIALNCWPNLKHLNIGSCINIDQWNVLVKKISTHCRNLRSLDLWRSNITNEALIELVTKCTQLEELDLGWCLRISSEADCFKMIASNIPKLKKLFLTSNRSVTDKDITILAAKCPLLEKLDVLGALNLTAESVSTLLQKCANLKMLDLSFCGGIDRRQIMQWSSQFPHCSILVSYQDKLCTKM